MARPRTRARAGVGLAVLGLALAACTRQAELAPVPGPPSTGPTTSTTAPVDFSRVVLPTVPGRTTTTADTARGRARIEGVVLGPDGPVEGASLRVQRYLGDQETRIDLLAGPGGVFQVSGAKGGRYRVRAWRPPDLAAPPQVFFLGDTDTVRLEFRMEPKRGTQVTSDVAPDAPQVGQPATLLVQVTSRSVDPEGVVRALPVQGALVGLTGSGAWRVQSPNPVVTDPKGQSSWLVVCAAAGAQPLTLVVNGVETFNLAVPQCRLPPSSTTTSAATAATTTTVRRTPTPSR